MYLECAMVPLYMLGILFCALVWRGWRILEFVFTYVFYFVLDEVFHGWWEYTPFALSRNGKSYNLKLHILWICKVSVVGERIDNFVPFLRAWKWT